MIAIDSALLKERRFHISPARTLPREQNRPIIVQSSSPSQIPPRTFDRQQTISAAPPNEKQASPEHASCSTSFVPRPARDLLPGDVISLASLKTVPADCVLLQGQVVTQESALTGEPMPINKFPVPCRDDFFPDPLTHGKKHFLFSGTDVMQSGQGSLAVVVATGVNTKRGDLLRKLLAGGEEEPHQEKSRITGGETGGKPDTSGADGGDHHANYNAGAATLLSTNKPIPPNSWYWERNLLCAIQLFCGITAGACLLNCIVPGIILPKEAVGGTFMQLLPQNFVENIGMLLYVSSPLIMVRSVVVRYDPCPRYRTMFFNATTTGFCGGSFPRYVHDESIDKLCPT